MAFRDEDHAVELANATQFGLVAGVWTVVAGVVVAGTAAGLLVHPATMSRNTRAATASAVLYLACFFMIIRC
jgi:hypothetical protein